MNHRKTKKKNMRKRKGQTRYCIIRGGGLNVQYNTVKVHKNSEINKNTTQKCPQLKFNMEPNKQYTLLMFDPDAAAKPSWAHWILINITSSNNYTTLLSYSPPSPPVGKHRYFFGLFEQTTGTIYPEIPYSRAAFNYMQFIDDNHLKLVAEKTIIVSA
jgi:phosphatidylethanolamine-binding protein (PEBP) family uncharacterized protein